MIPLELKKLYRQNRVIPFIGAGASMAVTWERDGKPYSGPSWREMVDKAIADLGFNPPGLLRARATDLQILEYYRSEFDGMQKLTNWLMSQMQPNDADLKKSKVHAALAKLINCQICYTTNFDDFIERALLLHGIDAVPIVSERDLAQAQGKYQVVKFHGDFQNPKAMVSSEQDYERRIQMKNPLDIKLRGDLLGNVVLFIGYSFRDWNVSYLFRVIQDTLGELPASQSGQRGYIIMNKPSDFERKLFLARNIGIIPVNNSDRTQGVADVLIELGS